MAVRTTTVNGGMPTTNGSNDVKKSQQKKTKRGPKLDFAPHFLRAFSIVSLFITVVAFVRDTVAKERQGLPSPGPKFNPQFSPFVSETVVFGTAIGYVVAVILGCRFMKGRSSLEGRTIRNIQAAYNVVQIVVCAYMVYGLLPSVGVYNGEKFMGIDSALSSKIEYFVFIHYLTKYLDWCDTFFMISKKKFNQVSFLHIFHHATIGTMWGIMLNEGVGSGTAAFGAFMNSLTHVIMYTHYFVTSFGIRNPFKRYITRWQLFQFATCLFHSLTVLTMENIIPNSFAWLQTMYQTLMLALFGLYMSWVPTWLTGYEPPKEKKEL